MGDNPTDDLTRRVTESLAKASIDWNRQLAGISDQINAYMRAQTSLAMQATELVQPYAALKSLTESVRPYHAAMQSLTQSMKPLQDAAQVLSRIDLTWVRDAWSAAMPPNWQELDPDDIDRVLEVMEETGWCLVWCSRVATVRALIEADGVETRTQVLLDSQSTVIEDLHDCLGAVKHEQALEYRRAASLAIRAFEDGHPEAAQALAASDVSAIINTRFRLKFADAKVRFTGDPRNQSISAFREQAVLSVVAQSLQQYHGATDPVPSSFSRHATAHSISRTQYTEVNSLASLLLAVALSAEVNELMMWADEQEQRAINS